jgi:hypothetical protein
MLAQNAYGLKCSLGNRERHACDSELYSREEWNILFKMYIPEQHDIWLLVYTWPDVSLS